MKTLLEINTEKFIKDGIKSIAHSDQKYFISTQTDSLEKGLRLMFTGLEMYCASHLSMHETAIGKDSYLSNYIEMIMQGLRGLESGCGRFDGGTLDKTLCRLAEMHELNID